MSEKSSYGQILKSSSLMGGASAFSMFIGMVKTKFAAVLIGTSGIGLLASFISIQNMVGNIAGLGLPTSAVRNIAKAVEDGDELAVAKTVITLRRICWLTGIAGMLLLMLLSSTLTIWTFGSDEYVFEVGALGVVVLFSNLAGGQTALIQGMRRIADLALLRVYSALLSAILAVACFYWFGLEGVAPALVIASIIYFSMARWYARHIQIVFVKMSWRESLAESRNMIGLGLALMWGNGLGLIVTYLTVTMVSQQLGLHAVGIYSAAFAISAMLVTFVLQAMGTDYYPRLASVSNSREKLNRLVNEQTEIGLLLIMPGLLLMLTTAPYFIQIFYTYEFIPAADLLHWFLLGCFIQVVQWPMGFLHQAMGRVKVLVVTRTIFWVAHIVLIWFGLKYFGLEGVSIAFVGAYAGSLAVFYWVSRYLTGFTWSQSVFRLLIIFTGVTALAFVVATQLSAFIAMLLGVSGTMVLSVFCMRNLVRLIGRENSIICKICKIPGGKFICGVL